MSKPYNPCDESDDWVVKAKEWELLRRNKRFRSLVLEKGGTWEPKMVNGKPHAVWRRFPIAFRILRAALEIEPGTLLVDSTFDAAYSHIESIYFWLQIDSWTLYVHPPNRELKLSLINRGYQTTYFELNDYQDDPDTDHHILLIPKRLPNSKARDEILKQIAGLIFLEGIDPRSLKSPSLTSSGKKVGSGYKGSYEQWDTYLKVEAYIESELEPGDTESPEIVNEALNAIILDEKGDSDGIRGKWITEYQARYFKIRRLIEEAFPHISELQ